MIQQLASRKSESSKKSLDELKWLTQKYATATLESSLEYQYKN